MIREATLEDVPRLVELGREFLSTTDYRSVLRENPEQMAAIATRLIGEDFGAFFVSEQGGRLTGMIGLFVFEHPISGDRVACELCWFVEPFFRGHGIRLLRRAERWAKEKGCAVLQMIAPTAQVGRVYEALGFTFVESNYQRVL